MNNTNVNVRPLPDGYLAVPIDAAQTAVPMRICALVRRQAEPAGGHLVVLRHTMDARIVLGCLADAGGAVHQWLELWIQDLSGLAAASELCRESLTNAVLDQRWRRRAEAMAALEGAAVIRTGWECDHPRPVAIDLDAAAPVHPADADSGDVWTLCTDDAVLAGRGLAAYSGSLQRYLYLAQWGPNYPFAATDDTAAAPAGCRPLAELVGPHVPLNPAGGLMMVRAHGPVGYETFCDLLGGGAWDGPLHGRLPLVVDPAVNAVSRDRASAWPDGLGFLGATGRAGRMAEALHLKLRLLADAVAQVRAAVAALGRPILSVTADSFRVHLGPTGRGLPLLWTGRAVLADPGDAVELAIAGSDERYFVPGAGGGMSIYRPASATGQVIRGTADVRIRQVMEDAGGAMVLEGTFATQERMAATPNDLVWVRLPVGGRRVDLCAHLEQQSALAAGEWRFRTIRQRLAGDVVAALGAAKGVPLSGVMFDVIPPMSSPSDLYALGVLAVRTLLVNAGTSLPIALDETLSLARQVQQGGGGPAPLAERIASVFAADGRWAASVGPGRLLAEPAEAGAALEAIPLELWAEVLAVLVAMFPGFGPDSRCADLADTRGGPLQGVFDATIDQLDRLGARTRSLVLIDWRQTREVHDAIRRHLGTP
ncbi:MAG: hypothetical protein GX591_02560 [Planctomycetes bacterium]|nr:hypothetical protein [Planctomycetota bacterium]